MTPPNGFISSFLVLLKTIGFLAILTGIKCQHILSSNQMSVSPACKGVVTSILTPSKGVRDCISLSSKGENVLNITMHTFYSEGDFEKNIQHPLSSLQGFTTSFADGYSEKLNTQIYFDMDSVFFVCDNSTSGQFCNDICKIIPDLLHQTNKSLTTANGTGPCLQEGTVRLQSLDDDITQHTFILNNCLFNPDSPVNLLLTRRLAEKFIDANRNPDEQTRIESRYSTHVLA